VGLVSVVELFELPQGVEQVSLVPDQGAVQQFATASLYSRARRSTRARTERTVRGRPGRFGRDMCAWRRATCGVPKT
jgi:hypothetical protein